MKVAVYLTNSQNLSRLRSRAAKLGATVIMRQLPKPFIASPADEYWTDSILVFTKYPNLDHSRFVFIQGATEIPEDICEGFKLVRVVPELTDELFTPLLPEVSEVEEEDQPIMRQDDPTLEEFKEQLASKFAPAESSGALEALSDSTLYHADANEILNSSPSFTQTELVADILEAEETLEAESLAGVTGSDEASNYPTLLADESTPDMGAIGFAQSQSAAAVEAPIILGSESVSEDFVAVESKGAQTDTNNPVSTGDLLEQFKPAEKIITESTADGDDDIPIEETMVQEPKIVPEAVTESTDLKVSATVVVDSEPFLEPSQDSPGAEIAATLEQLDVAPTEITPKNQGESAQIEKPTFTSAEINVSPKKISDEIAEDDTDRHEQDDAISTIMSKLSGASPISLNTPEVVKPITPVFMVEQDFGVDAGVGSVPTPTPVSLVVPLQGDLVVEVPKPISVPANQLFEEAVPGDNPREEPLVGPALQHELEDLVPIENEEYNREELIAELVPDISELTSVMDLSELEAGPVLIPALPQIGARSNTLVSLTDEEEVFFVEPGQAPSKAPRPELPAPVNRSRRKQPGIKSTSSAQTGLVPHVPNVPTNRPNTPQSLVDNMRSKNQQSLSVAANQFAPRVTPKIASQVPKSVNNTRRYNVNQRTKLSGSCYLFGNASHAGGASTLAYNFACECSRDINKKVLLMDLDLTSAKLTNRLYKQIGLSLDDSCGIENILNISAKNYITKLDLFSAGISNARGDSFSFIRCHPAYPYQIKEVLGMANYNSFINVLKQAFDVIVIDIGSFVEEKPYRTNLLRAGYSTIVAFNCSSKKSIVESQTIVEQIPVHCELVLTHYNVAVNPFEIEKLTQHSVVGTINNCRAIAMNPDFSIMSDIAQNNVAADWEKIVQVLVSI